LASIAYNSLVRWPLAAAGSVALVLVAWLWRRGVLSPIQGMLICLASWFTLAWLAGVRTFETLAALRVAQPAQPATDDGARLLAQLESVQPDSAQALQVRLTYQAFAALAAQESQALWLVSPSATSRPLARVLAAYPALVGQYRSSLLAPVSLRAALNPTAYEFLSAQPLLAGLQGFAWQQAHATCAATAHTWWAVSRQRDNMIASLVNTAGVPAAATVVVRLGRPTLPDPTGHVELFFAG
jgi:hypothetical protein